MIGSAPAVAVVSLARGVYWPLRMRIRQWGRLPLRRGPTVLIANHQHEDESEIICERGFLQGPWKRPIFTASSRRMYEPGFFAQRMPALRFARRWNASSVFLALGLLPLENELSSRPLASLAWDASTRHGDLPLRTLFSQAALEGLGPGAERCSDLFEARFFAASQRHVKLSLLHEPYRGEAIARTRAQVEEDIARIVGIVREGATFYVTPEGFYTTDGRMRPLKGIVTRLTPVARTWLAAIAFDPFRGRRLSMLYRIVPPADPARLADSLAAARPVTTTQLLARRLAALEPGAAIGREEALAAVNAARYALPGGLFVDPELAREAAACVDDALATLQRRGTLIGARNGRYAVGAVREDGRFPGVADMIAYQAVMLDQTESAARRLGLR